MILLTDVSDAFDGSDSHVYVNPTLVASVRQEEDRCEVTMANGVRHYVREPAVEVVALLGGAA